jgi:prevent-host-death family protein
MEDETMPISEARANLTDLVGRVRWQRHCVMLTQRGARRAAIVPADLGDAIADVGGPDAALAILRQASQNS